MPVGPLCYTVHADSYLRIEKPKKHGAYGFLFTPTRDGVYVIGQAVCICRCRCRRRCELPRLFKTCLIF